MYQPADGLQFIPGTWFTLLSLFILHVTEVKSKRIFIGREFSAVFVEITNGEAHKIHLPDSLIDLFDSDRLIGERFADVDLELLEKNASAV